MTDVDDSLSPIRMACLPAAGNGSHLPKVASNAAAPRRHTDRQLPRRTNEAGAV